MRLRHVPGGEIGGFVRVAPQVQPEGRLGRTLRKFEIGSRVVTGVYADHHKLVDRAGIEIVHQFGKRARPASARRLVDFDAVDRCLHLGVDPMHQRVGFGWKRPACQYDGRAVVRRQVGRRLFCQTHRLIRERGVAKRRAHRMGDGDGHLADQLRLKRHPMVRLGAGQRRRGLDAVDPRKLCRAADGGELRSRGHYSVGSGPGPADRRQARRVRVPCRDAGRSAAAFRRPAPRRPAALSSSIGS